MTFSGFMQKMVWIATLMFFSFVFLIAYALLAYKAKSWLANSGRMKLVRCISGSIFVGFGVLLTTTHS